MEAVLRLDVAIVNGQPSPGLAKVASGAVGARVEVDGAELARTDIVPGEFTRDVEERLKLAVGQRGGLK